MPRAIPIEDEIGKRYGRLTVLRFHEYKTSHNGNRSPVYEFACDCGGTTIASIYAVRYGNTLSCGCLQRERAAAFCESRRKTHGKTKTPEFGAWDSMIDRTTNPLHPAYKNYGGRGVGVCESWLSSFEMFLADMGERPSKFHSLDRIDNSKGYQKENCRWATLSEQANNKRTNRRIQYNGRNLTVTQWSVLYGQKASTLFNRLYDGWDIERALLTPVRRKQ